MSEDIIILFVIVVLPIIPAFILYKFLPSKASAKGPFKGLNIHVKGAFAGYFIVLLFIAGFFLMHSSKESKYELWTITGGLELEQGQFNDKDIVISITPPEQKLYPNGRFIIKKVLMPKKEEIEKPSLLIQKDGYEIVPVILDAEMGEIPGLPDYQIKYSKKDKNIDIKKTIILRKKSERGEYKEETAIAATPLEG